ncbi:class I SAM-dependent methyltransferase [Thiorhodococcus fuscus]|uniref:Class I SAM-dependent methyltransferase n=1 Tax=Thiorhodococcus fuscus TaxID=527200 RepID=A0ABW4Y9H8_9GAMM
MSNNSSFQDKSYERHADHFREHAAGGTLAEHAQTWLARDTVDAWLHERLYGALDPILTQDPEAAWLTVGDGRFGKDATYILEHDGHALATDISETLLKEAQERGLIRDYAVENAEALSFDDASFDYVFCKEAYHHFPRPMLALYEMLRVTKKAVCLLEPQDLYVGAKPTSAFFAALKNTVKQLLGRPAAKHNFEDSGNYVYSISRREMEKVALGINLRMVAFKGFNSAYFKGAEYERLTTRGPIQRRVKSMIGIQDALCRVGIGEHGLLAAILFKEVPAEPLATSLTDAGYDLIRLPENPYIAG